MKTRHHFNLIEIILTVALIAFGVVVILGMLPKGLRASRMAGFESYTSEVIDQMASFLQQKGAAGVTATVSSESNDKTFIDAFVSGGDIDIEIMENYPRLVAYLDLFATRPGDLSSKFTRTNTAGVFKYEDGTPEHEKGIYVIVMGDNYTNTVGGDDETETRIDFSGMLRTWKRPRSYDALRMRHAAGVHDCFAEKCYENYELDTVEVPLNASGSVKGATVCMELSYPLSLPYAERTKRYYSFEVGE